MTGALFRLGAPRAGWPRGPRRRVWVRTWCLGPWIELGLLGDQEVEAALAQGDVARRPIAVGAGSKWFASRPPLLPGPVLADRDLGLGRVLVERGVGIRRAAEVLSALMWKADRVEALR